MINQFDDIRPYTDAEVQPTVNRLLKDDEFIAVVARFRFPRYPNSLLKLMQPVVRQYLKKQTRDIKTVDDLQDKMEVYVRRMINETSSGLTVSGLDHLSPDKAHLFISNHRDIVVDPAIVNWTLHQHKHKTLNIAIGDNLLTKPYISDLMRLNKSFIVNRSATAPREKLKAAKHLSSYIHYAIVEEQANIWIAQREGRAKDGVDRTNKAVIGMLSLSKPKKIELVDYIRELNIVPISISYELDPCDITKANELYVQKTEGNYEKDEQEDAYSIARGITGYKGRMHLAFGEPLVGDYQNTDDIVAELDKKIIHNYVLQPSNCIAYKELHGELPDNIDVTDHQIPFDEETFHQEVKKFRQHIAKCDENYRDILLSAYANPIVSQQTQG